MWGKSHIHKNPVNNGTSLGAASPNMAASSADRAPTTLDAAQGVSV
jgi:hypothetical protein